MGKTLGYHILRIKNIEGTFINFSWVLESPSGRKSERSRARREERRGPARRASRSPLLPGHPLPAPPAHTRSPARRRAHTPRAGPAPRRAPHTRQPEPRQPQRDGGGAHRAPCRLARGAPRPDGAPASVDVGSGWRRDHLGRDGWSWAPRGPGFASAGSASSYAAVVGKPVARGAGDGAEGRRAGAPVRTRASTPARRR